jgi:type VI protein secretion system component Hcp
VYVTTWSQSASDGSGLPQESMSLSYNKIIWDYKPQDATGALGATTKKGYNVTENKVQDA